jgi:hypothetical protein
VTAGTKVFLWRFRLSRVLEAASGGPFLGGRPPIPAPQPSRAYGDRRSRLDSGAEAGSRTGVRGPSGMRSLPDWDCSFFRNTILNHCFVRGERKVFVGQSCILSESLFVITCVSAIGG